MASESTIITICTPVNTPSNQSQTPIDVSNTSKEVSEKSLSCMCFKFILAGLFILTSIQLICHHLRWGDEGDSSASREWCKIFRVLQQMFEDGKDFDKMEKRL